MKRADADSHPTEAATVLIVFCGLRGKRGVHAEASFSKTEFL
jgi:hypothetical protein